MLYFLNRASKDLIIPQKENRHSRVFLIFKVAVQSVCLFFQSSLVSSQKTSSKERGSEPELPSKLLQVTCSPHDSLIFHPFGRKVFTRSTSTRIMTRPNRVAFSLFAIEVLLAQYITKLVNFQITLWKLVVEFLF